SPQPASSRACGLGESGDLISGSIQAAGNALGGGAVSIPHLLQGLHRLAVDVVLHALVAPEFLEGLALDDVYVLGVVPDRGTDLTEPLLWKLQRLSQLSQPVRCLAEPCRMRDAGLPADVGQLGGDLRNVFVNLEG